MNRIQDIHTMHPSRWIPMVIAVAASACGGSQAAASHPTVGGRQHIAPNTPVTATGTAVSEDAHTRFTQAAQAMRQHDEANNGRGDWTPDTCNSIAHQFEQAAQAQAGSNFPEAWLDRGLVYDRCGMSDQEQTALQRALDNSNGNYCRAKVQLGVLAYRTHNVAAAEQMFQQAIQQDQTHCVEGYTNLAMVLREQNPTTDQQWGEVVRNIRAALALDDRFLPARNQLALSYLQQAGDDPNSQRIFLASLVCQQAVQVAAAAGAELTPEVHGYVADLYNTWGVIDMRHNEIIKALGHFQRAFQMNPNMFEAWVNYGTINLSFRGYADARDAFQHAVALRPNDYDAHVGLGVALRGLAAQTAPDDPQHAQLIQQAQAEYQRAEQIDAARPDVYYNLGALNMSYLGNTIPDLHHAEDFFNQFVAHAGQQPRYADAVGRANHNIHNIQDTIHALEAVGSTPTPSPAAPAGATPAPATPPAAATTGATPVAPATGATPAVPATSATPPTSATPTAPGVPSTPPAGGATSAPPAAASTPTPAGATPAAPAAPAPAH